MASISGTYTNIAIFLILVPWLFLTFFTADRQGQAGAAPKTLNFELPFALSWVRLGLIFLPVFMIAPIIIQEKLNIYWTGFSVSTLFVLFLIVMPQKGDRDA